MNDLLSALDETQIHRYAVYFAPKVESPWWQAGSSWLGRCAATGELLSQPVLRCIDGAAQARATLAPRRYGWHATLRSPFSLAAGVALDQLRSRLRDLSRNLQPFELPPMKVTRLGNFLALVPVERCEAVDHVAEACLLHLHELAAPPSPGEIARRRMDKLSPQEDALLLEWGYPFVMQRFRFHMSLTGRLEGMAPTLVQRLENEAACWFDGLPPLVFGSLSLFAEPAQDSSFILMEQFDLTPREAPRAA